MSDENTLGAAGAADAGAAGAEAGAESGTDSTQQENLLGTAGNAADETGEGEGAGKADEKEAEKAPELNIPEGAEIDADLLEAMKAKDPQKAVDAFLAAEQKRAEGWAKQQKEWVAEVKKEWGDKADYNLNLANRALHKFGSEELTGFLKQSGIGNHPAMIKLFHRIAEADAEDTVAGTAAAPTKTPTRSDALRGLYDKSPDLKF